MATLPSFGGGQLLLTASINLVNPKGNQPWIFIGRTDAEAPILWLPDTKSRFIAKDPDARKDWRKEEKGRQRMRLLDGITDSMHLSLSKLRDGERMGKPGVLLSVEWIRVGYDWLTITNHQSTLLIWQWGWLCFLIFSSFNYLWNHPGLYEQLILWPQYISDAKLLEICLFIFIYFNSIFIRKH